MTLEIKAGTTKTYDVKLVGEMVKVKPLKTAFAMHLIGIQDKIKKDPRCIELLGDSKKIIAHGDETFNKWRRARPVAYEPSCIWRVGLWLTSR